MSGTVTPPPGYRAEMRDAVAAALALHIPGVPVHRARVWPVDDTARPALLVYGYAEKKTCENPKGPLYRKLFDVRCSMVVKARTAGRDPVAQEVQLEALLGSVERAVLNAPALWLGPGVLESCPEVTTMIDVQQRGDSVEAEATTEFQLSWHETFEVPEPDADACTPDGATVAFTYPAP